MNASSPLRMVLTAISAAGLETPLQTVRFSRTRSAKEYVLGSVFRRKVVISRSRVSCPARAEMGVPSVSLARPISRSPRRRPAAGLAGVHRVSGSAAPIGAIADVRRRVRAKPFKHRARQPIGGGRRRSARPRGPPGGECGIPMSEDTSKSTVQNKATGDGGVSPAAEGTLKNFAELEQH